MAREESTQFDAIIVGGGLAGLSAAYTLAEAGFDVMVLERGDYCGAKNVTGGRIYVNPVRELFPDIWKKAPLERFIAHEEVCIMDKARSITVRYDGSELSREPYQSFSVMRAKFDKWFAKQAERKGAMIITKTRVDDILFDNGKVVGVRAGGDELLADVVIACDGVLSFTAEKAGLRKPAKARNFAVGFKEIIELDRSVLENRFNLEGDEGAARMFLGDVTAGKFGGGFLYTNKESISLGIVVGINALSEEEPSVKAPELLEIFKQRPEIARLIQGGETVEYSAHVIPEGGLNSMGQLYGDGILVAGDAAGFSMNIGITVRGMEYAMASGCYAAQTVIKAKQKKNYSAASLAVYEQMLKESFVMKDFISFKESLDVLEYPRFFQQYPELAGNIMKDLYEIPAGPKEKIFQTIKKYMTFRELWGMFNDFRRVRKI
jgi:electron transfer flavoprotein-quinone oxidoreductase